MELGNGDWGLGTEDWGLGTGDWGLGTGELSFVMTRRSCVANADARTSLPLR
ncbi:MAG: hypothetical protein KME21_23520 [Desmonostoc vinosum HA7617-LM4]|nr:hypothetical protein [Desmonostoc vinosum HA7617-LM4]